MDYYSRLIPDVEHSQYHNHMNPPGEAFIYLGVIPKRKGAADIIEKGWSNPTLTGSAIR